MLKKAILNLTVFKKRIHLLKNKIDLYESIRKDADIYNHQVEKFNGVWKYCYENFDFYKYWKEEHQLPNSVNSVEDIKIFPNLTKRDIQIHKDLVFKDLEKIQTISTGGSTGEPTKYPTNKLQKEIEYANTYLGKHWWGIKPLDGILMFWGHSHLFGNGLKGKINCYKRLLFDFLINTTRFSAYNMTDSTLVKNISDIKNINPTAIIGYTSIISKLSKLIVANKLPVGKKSKLKGIICTSETVSDYDIEIVSRAFKNNVIIEYGMAECGVIAYSKEQTNNLTVFWDSFIATQDKDGILSISTLYDRAFPLINYKTDDIIEVKDVYNESVLSMVKILGRSNDLLKIINDGNTVQVHSELFTHLMKSLNGVINFQIIQKKDLSIVINYVSLTTNLSIRESFFTEIERVFGKIERKQFNFFQVEGIEKTVSGKSKWVIIEND
ncbi:hypothetical protein [Vibrio coralliilyticus]|uniref:hypothetical protein n=1 Tax=Vibrio coralliilyticus TaxID=190893 RepID=UPI0015608C25|nr:hypothetical protein [Vibrio coralliilyticus]NRF15949.1 hypothetical protein [Vibrio coralliilyticus]